MTARAYHYAVAHVVVACPHLHPETDEQYASECDADCTVTLCVEPDDRHDGADRDGRRGEFRRGAVTVDDWTSACGCALTEAEQATLGTRARAAFEAAVRRSWEVSP